jgi:hypothetical protein
MDIKYSVVEKAADPLDSVIEKTGATVKFTMRQLDQADAQMQRTLKEITSQRDLEKAKMTNIENNHPEVLKMTDEQLFTAAMYQEAKRMVGMLDPKIVEFQKALDTDLAEKAVIETQCPEVVPAPVATPEATAATADTAAPAEATTSEPAASESVA